MRDGCWDTFLRDAGMSQPRPMTHLYLEAEPDEAGKFAYVVNAHMVLMNEHLDPVDLTRGQTLSVLEHMVQYT